MAIGSILQLYQYSKLSGFRGPHSFGNTWLLRLRLGLNAGGGERL